MTAATDFIPIIIMLAFAVGVAFGIIILSHIIGRRKPNPVKQDFYECGVPPLTSQRMRFHVRFFIIATLFIVFDFEGLCLLPWAIRYRALLDTYGWAMPLLEVLVFLGILLVGFIYVWRKGALKWE